MNKLVLFLLAAIALTAFTLTVKLPELDKSPHDIAHHKVLMQPKIKVLYGRPSKNGREIFGELVKYGKTWRTGANESTEIKFYQDVKIDGNVVKAGTYSLFTVPEPTEWTIILNSDLDTWGHYQYKKKNDVLRVSAKATSSDESVESFTIAFDKTSSGADMVLAWDKTRVTLPIVIE